jgi:hypothetical protein
MGQKTRFLRGFSDSRGENAILAIFLKPQHLAAELCKVKSWLTLPECFRQLKSAALLLMSN